MTTTAERLASEQLFHDQQAADRAATFRHGLAGLVFADDNYLNHETWVRPAFDKLGNLRGKRVLDYGCGHGMAAVVLARQGAAVTAFDLSPGYVREAAERAAANGVAGRFVVADGENLPFADGEFEAGVAAIATPVRSATGEIASIGISGNSARLRDEAYRSRVIDTLRECSKAIGALL